jgi:SnoaL-like domain
MPMISKVRGKGQEEQAQKQEEAGRAINSYREVARQRGLRSGFDMLPNEKERIMDQTTRAGRRQLLAQGGAAALAGIALQGALIRRAAAQDATPGAATPTPITAAPGADCPGQEQVEQNLALFDRLDFEAWNNRDWELFRELHGEHVHVAGFGQATEGIDAHLAWAQAFTGQFPDARVVTHPIRIGAGDWTAATGLLRDGSTMATIARWENGRIAEEYVFSLMV